MTLTILGKVASLQGFITVSEYDTTWLVIAGGDALKRASAYQANYHLTPGIYDPSGEDPVEVYYFDMVFWLAIAAFALSPSGACLEGCPMLEFSS